MEELPRTRSNVATIRSNIMDEGIKSLQKDRDNLKDFRQISNLEAMLREFLGKIVGNYRFDETKEQKNETKGSESSLKNSTSSNATSSSTRQSASTRHKGKEVAKLITPQSESVSEEDNNPEQAQRDKEMQKNLALLAKYFKKLYKPTNNNLRTSSNSRNKNEDTTPRDNYHGDQYYYGE
ncbi:hypothetical protein Tco_0798965 [Tanacetum coccineum]